MEIAEFPPSGFTSTPITISNLDIDLPLPTPKIAPKQPIPWPEAPSSKYHQSSTELNTDTSLDLFIKLPKKKYSSANHTHRSLNSKNSPGAPLKKTAIPKKASKNLEIYQAPLTQPKSRNITDVTEASESEEQARDSPTSLWGSQVESKRSIYAKGQTFHGKITPP